MRKVIDFFGFLFNKILLVVMALFIGIFIPLMAVATVLSDGSRIKGIVSESKILKTIPENILYLVPYENEQTQEQRESPTSQKTSLYEAMDKNGALDPDELIQNITTVLDEQFLKSQANGLIDSVYDYAQGNTEELKFAVSLESKSTEINTVMKEYLVESFDALPPCDPEDASQLQSQEQGEKEVDILSLSCKPADKDLNAEIGSFVDEFTGAGGPLSKTYTQDSLNLSSVDTSLLQYAHGSLKKLIMIGWLFMIGIGIVVIMTARNLHVGLKYVGANYIASGIMFVAAFLFLVGSLDVIGNALQKNQSLSDVQKQATIRIAEPLYDAVLKAISTQAILYSVILIILGVVLYGLGVLAKKYKYDHIRLHHYHDAQQLSAQQTSAVASSSPPDTSQPQQPPVQKP